MDLRTCYERLGGSLDDVLSRIPSERLADKFIRRFPGDESFAHLCEAMAAGNRKEAFMMAHTLKGVCANLSLTRLQLSASALTECLRPEADVLPAQAPALFETVKADYAHTVGIIREYIDQAQ